MAGLVGLKGLLPTGGTAAANISVGFSPFTFQLDSTSASAAIAISADGVHFFTATPTISDTHNLLYTYNGPLAQAMFTGAAGDAWTIL